MKKSIVTILAVLALFACKNNPKTTSEVTAQDASETKYPSDVIPFMDKWSILCGDGTKAEEVVGFEHKGFFYTENEDNTDWVVYKTPNSGITSRTSSNTRTEMGQKTHWKPMEGGKLTGTLKVQHVSTSGDARVAASYSVVIGHSHGTEGHGNEPLKIFYKKFPGHRNGSVYWNYEINTAGDDNSGRWDFSSAVWGYDMSVIGTAPDSYPAEPKDGIALGEEFSYEINVFEGIMYLTFASKDHETKTFTKSLIKSEFTKELPQQIKTLYGSIGRDGLEREDAYAGELQNFKQGAYNQTNGKTPEDNMVWSTGAAIYDGDIAEQYANGSYTEVWFKQATLGAGTPPNN